MEKISVAIATYNGERFLREQLDSLYGQTRVPDEVCVSDDCSKDGTVAILKEYQQKYGLKYSVNKCSLGVNKNFENAIRSCIGDYVMICDQDDIWLPQKIEKTYTKIKEIEGDKPAVVSSQCWRINACGQIISKKTKISKDTFSCADTILQPPGTTQGCSLMINRKLLNVLKTFPDTKECMYDGYIGFVGASIGIKYNIASPLMLYRYHESNVLARISTKSKTLSQRILNKLKVLLSPAVIPYKRRFILGNIKRDYGHLFLPGVNDIYAEAFLYFSCESVLDQIICITKMSELNIEKKFRLILGTIIYGINNEKTI